jgi:hypothetical protein
MLGPRFPRCFLSCSFDEADTIVATWFTELLYAMDFEVLTGRMPQARPPAEKVRDLIRESDVVVSVLTRRDKIEGREAWRPPDWLHNEIGIAYDSNKPTAVFVEDGVEVSGLTPLITQYERWKRDSLGEAAPRIVRYLTSVRNTIASQLPLTNEVAVVRALIYELFLRSLEIAKADETLELNTWNLASAYALITGRLFSLPPDVISEVNEAYSAVDRLGKLVEKAKAPSSGWITIRGKQPDEAKRQIEIQKVRDQLKIEKVPAGEKVLKAIEALAKIGWPELLELVADRRSAKEDALPKDAGSNEEDR